MHPIVWATLVVGGVAQLGYAQEPRLGRSAGSAVAPEVLHDLPFASSDSARMAWGHVNFTRYETPYQCEHAAKEVRALVLRRTLDTARYSDRVHTTWPAIVRTTAQACFTHINAPGIEQIAPRSLWALFNVALLSDDAAAIQAVFRRLLALAPTVAAREDITLRVMENFMDDSTRPIKLDSARSFLTQLSAQGASAVTQLKGRNLLAKYYANMFDIPAHRQQLDSAIALIETLPAAERNSQDVLGQQLELAYGYVRDAMFTAPQTIHSLLEEIKRRAIESKHPAASLVVAGATNQQRFYDALGVAAPLITQADAPIWLNWPGDTSHVWPQPGKVSLLITLGNNAATSDFFVLLANALQRLITMYGEQGLEITLLVPTHGYAFSNRVLTPEAEAAELQTLIHRVLKLPVRLVVVESPMGTLPEPDARRYERGNAPLIQSLPGRMILTDRQGRIIAISNDQFHLDYGTDDEAMWDAFIRRAVTQTP